MDTNSICPIPLTSIETYEKVKNVIVIFGKMKKKKIVIEILKKRSIFFIFRIGVS